MSENPLTSENAASIVARAKGIIMTPNEEWPKIVAEGKSIQQIFLSYALPLMLIGPICTFLGTQIFGINALMFTIRPTVGMSLSMALTTFVMSIISLFVLTFIANVLSPQFGGKDDLPGAFRLVAYSSTVSWVLGVLSLVVMAVPILGLLGLLGLYGLYLLYLGSTPVMGVPQEKSGVYVGILIVVAIVLYIIVGAVSSRVMSPALLTL